MCGLPFVHSLGRASRRLGEKGAVTPRSKCDLPARSWLGAAPTEYTCAPPDASSLARNPTQRVILSRASTQPVILSRTHAGCHSEPRFSAAKNLALALQQAAPPYLSICGWQDSWKDKAHVTEIR